MLSSYLPCLLQFQLKRLTWLKTLMCNLRNQEKFAANVGSFTTLLVSQIWLHASSLTINSLCIEHQPTSSIVGCKDESYAHSTRSIQARDGHTLPTHSMNFSLHVLNHLSWHHVEVMATCAMNLITCVVNCS